MSGKAPILNLLTSLHFTHPSFLPLLQTHQPLAHPSASSQSQLTKLLNRLNTVILARDDTVEKRAACEIAREMVEQDEEGWVMSNWGKGWVGGCLGWIASATSPISTTPPYLTLLSTIVLSAPHFPAFERETVHPIMGKLSVSLSKLLDRCLAEPQPEWDVLLVILTTIQSLLTHTPANFRPSVPFLKPALIALILSFPTATSPDSQANIPFEIKEAAGKLLASLHVTAGKAQSSAAWGAEMKDCLGGIGRALGGIVGDAWEEDAVRVNPPAAPSALPGLPTDPALRFPIALDWLEGYTGAITELLRFPTIRPVSVPIAGITVSYITPQHHAALLSALPRIWSAGFQLLGAVALVCGDHLFPHLANILDHTIWVAERLPLAMAESQLQLLKFHTLFFSLYPSSLHLTEYPTRLLRLCLSRLTPLIEPRSKASDSVESGAGAGGKRGKKRARGAEDGLVGGLEGRGERALGEDECAIIVAALKLTPLLHTTPLLPPSLLSLSIRLHLSLHLLLPTLPSSRFVSPSSKGELIAQVAQTLEDAVGMGADGWGRGWESTIIAVLQPQAQSSAAGAGKLSLVLHPALPPMLRPAPPLAHLHFFKKEGEEEKKERLALGLALDTDLPEDETDHAEGGMEVDVREVSKTATAWQQAGAAGVRTVQTSTTSSVAAPVPQAVPVKQSVLPPAPAVPAYVPAVAPAPVAVAASAPTIPAPAPAVVQPIEASTSFISAPTTAGPSTSTVETATTTEKVQVMQVDGEEDEDEGIPEMDSGSDDDFDDEDEEDE
ncbi:hypothetical protein IAT38_006276 [Cryptococcus sp. DSM 104549]